MYVGLQKFICSIWMQLPKEPEKDVRSPKLELQTTVYYLGIRNWTQALHKNHQTFFIAEPSLQPLKNNVLWHIKIKFSFQCPFIILPGNRHSCLPLWNGMTAFEQHESRDTGEPRHPGLGCLVRVCFLGKRRCSFHTRTPKILSRNHMQQGKLVLTARRHNQPSF